MIGATLGGHKKNIISILSYLGYILTNFSITGEERMYKYRANSHIEYGFLKIVNVYPR